MPCRASALPAAQVSEHNGRMRRIASALLRQAPNLSIERTSLSWLRQPKAAAHVER